MSKLDELIAELCPDGVTDIPMGSLMKRVKERGKDAPDVSQVYAVSNTKGMVRAEDFRDNTIHSEDTSNYTVVREGMVAYNPSRLNIGSIAMLKTDLPGLVSPMYVVFSIDENKVDRDYFDYLIHSTYVANKVDSFKEEGARFRFDFSRWDWIMVQIPPKPIQAEIVRILDSFKKLSIELSAELSARRKQYEYYRDSLLMSAKDNVEYSVQELVDLGMIEEPMDGNHGDIHPKKADYVATGVPFVMANNLVNGTVDYEHCAYITEHQASSLRKGFSKPGDVLLTHKGTIGRTAIVPQTYATTILTPQVTYYRVKSGIDNHFLKYCFDSTPFQEQMIAMAGLGGTRAYIGITAQHALKLRLPPLAEQKRISTILNAFDNLCNNLAFGLPAEIEARQKQYEYYRDKFLTFKEKV